MGLSPEQIIQQSKNAYNQWKDNWRNHSKQHALLAPHKPLTDFTNIGVGRACLLVANGYSLEENIDVIREKQGNVDIFCCDKTLGSLIENGITPTYCMVCDSIVDYEKYLEPYKDKLQDTILFMNVCANPKWSHNGNWKDKYFFVNQDSIHTEREFAELSKCPNLIPAGTNVSNAMVVFMSQSGNEGRKNFFGYDKLLLIGFDYSWTRNGRYYAFNTEGDGKKNYMKHMYLTNADGQPCYTSTNLHFSATWLAQYVKTFQVPVVQCSKNTILSVQHFGDLAKQMDYNYKEEDASLVRSELAKRDKLFKEIQDIEKRVLTVGKDHYFKMLASL